LTSVALLLLVPVQGEAFDTDEFPKELQARALSATVRVVNVSQKLQGSGTIIRQEKGELYILTAKHFLEKAEEVEVHTFSNKSPPALDKVYGSARVLARGKGIRDLALLRVRSDDPAPGVLPVCPSDPKLELGRGEVFSVGFGEGDARTGFTDSVEKRLVRREGEEIPMWEGSKASSRGRSGGAIVDKRGYLVGVASGVNDGKAYYCHIDDIRAFLKTNGVSWLYEEKK
jgi:S1-C subfamily serine protease